MSVHTWTYKKVSALSEEKKLDIVERAIDAADWWERKEELADLQKHGFDALRKHGILGVNFIDHNGETYFLIGCDVPVRVLPKKVLSIPKRLSQIVISSWSSSALRTATSCCAMWFQKDSLTMCITTTDIVTR